MSPPAATGPDEHRRALAAALLVTVLWSSSWVLIKVGLEDDLGPLTFAGLRYVLAATLLLALVLRRPAAREQLRGLGRPGWRRLALLGLVMYAATQGAQFVGLALLPAATLSLVLSMTPLLTTVAAARLLGEPATGRQWLGMAIALVGAAAYLARDLEGGGGAGMAVAVTALVANAAASLLGRAVNRDGTLSALVVTATSMAVGATALLAVGLAVEGVPAPGPRTWAIVAWLAVVNTALAFTLWNHSLRHLSATESSAVNNTMLVQIAVLAWVFLGEALTAVEVGGLLVAAAGVALVQRRDRVRRRDGVRRRDRVRRRGRGTPEPHAGSGVPGSSRRPARSAATEVADGGVSPPG